MLRHSPKIRARVSGKVALFTAAMLALTSVAQYALDGDLRSGQSQTANTSPARAADSDANERVTAEVAERSLSGGNISLMIFRIN